MAENQNYLDIVHKLSQKGYQLKDVYRNIRNRELFIIAYGNLYANQGATTVGTNPDDTIDGMSLERIDTIIEQLKSGTYKWKPSRRVYIPKRNGKMRPLSVPNWSDKLVQEVIRMVLEAYYEPKFSKYSHGFRPNKGCHTALVQIRETWKGTKWFIEGDIKGCFDNIDHHILLDVLSKSIKDNRFLKLVRQMLEAGYIEDWRYNETLSGTPQGGVVSPLLANIFLNELDEYVERMMTDTNKVERRRKSALYNKKYKQKQKAEKTGDKELARVLTLELRTLPNRDPNDPDYRRLRYNRYADDFILGFAGPRNEANEIKEKITLFLKSMKLELSEEKTLITHATEGKARYLGYELNAAKDNTRLTQRQDGKRSTQARSINYRIQLTVPHDVKEAWQNKYMKNRKPIHRPELLQMSDFEIVQTYGQELRGIVNYYALANNVSKVFNGVRYASIRSAARTLASKHKTPSSGIYAKYKRKNSKGITCLIIEVDNPNNPEKPLRTELGGEPIRQKRDDVIEDKKYYPRYSRNELTRRLLANECELCGDTNGINVHHIRKLADIKKKYRGRPNPPQWVRFMMERNRKTVVVCKTCHQSIHNGGYSGKVAVNKN